MNNESTFETLDWDAEAKRMALAFGLKGECEFREADYGDMQLWSDLAHEWHEVPAPLNIKLRISYCQAWRMISIEEPDNWSAIMLPWNGNPHAPRGFSMREYYKVFIAKGLFDLGLLTPQIEDRMGVALTAHEKLEWRLEYEARNGL